MCGIFCYLGSPDESHEVMERFLSTMHRGPDTTRFSQYDNVFLGFHRLGINDLSSSGDQPMTLNEVHLVCNGEIYNWQQLKEKYNMQLASRSDCEVILHLYIHLRASGATDADVADALCNELDGEFAFALYDSTKQRLFVTRDPYGVRPLFFGVRGGDRTYFGSELKNVNGLVDKADQFPPGTVAIYDTEAKRELARNSYRKFDPHCWHLEVDTDYKDALQRINQLLRAAVNKRVHNSDRRVCSLLSGGLDSSLVSAIATQQFPPHTFETFSIGLKGSTDLAFSKIVADYIQSKHTIVELTPQDFLDAIEDTVRITESYDTTTVRASVGNYLVSKYIRKNTENKVVLNGDYSDEVTGGYIYLKNCLEPDAFADDCFRLVNNIHYFDSLRSDRTICSQGLEARTPFSDKAFIEYYMSLPPAWRMSHDKMEKQMLRKAFSRDNLLPPEILWRRKEAFSDGVSNPEQSWHKIVTEHVAQFVSDEEFERRAEIYPFNTPELKESFYYRKLFEKYYNHPEVIPYYWLPRFCGDMKDPSAREIKELY